MTPAVSLERRGLLKPGAAAGGPAAYDALVVGNPAISRYLKLDDPSSSGTSIPAVATVGANGTYNNAPGPNVAGPGATQRATQLNGSNAWIMVPSTPTSSTFGLEIWVYVDSDGSGYDVFTTDVSSGPGFGYLLREDASDKLWRWDSFNTNWVIPRAAWHQIVLGGNGGGGQTIWVDGGGAGKKFTNANNGALGNFIQIGQSASHLLKGRVCRFSFYTAMPTDQEVADRYAAGVV